MGKSSEKSTVTMYQISKELALENNLDFVKKDIKGNINIVEERRNSFDNFKKDQTRKFKELLNTTKINLEVAKNNNKEFAIPLEYKDYTKFILQNFSSPAVKAIRKNEFGNLPFTLWRDTLIELIDYCTKEVNDPEEKNKIKHRMLANHHYFSNERHEKLVNRFSSILKRAEMRFAIFDHLEDNNYESLNEIGVFRMISEDDVIQLYDYLDAEIEKCFTNFGKVADMFSELRDQEIEDKAIESLFSDEDIKFDESKDVLIKAVRETNNG
ncbi:hypothetical protein R3398_20795 [Rossellomorea marisflavi]|uniref:hypothetical protein n=1 Tax=Rossellomorea marisflavi TaxID=189381 RepID=UPI00296F7E99|nr:hypothetical protein [Rossellomorea marisflavi]MDW4528787.1 hypothetical protein [Rossellomorea marisflavi]